MPLLIAAGTLPGCAGPDPGPCRLRPVADLPVTLDANRVEVAARINGAEIRMLLDTGAERTVLAAATAATLQLPRSQRSATRLSGVAGSVSNADVFATLTLGSESASRRFALAALPGLGGLVGGDVLSGYDLELDFPGRRARLWHAPGCGAADLPWTGPRVTVPVRVSDGNLLRLTVVVDGVAFDALLDTGAPFSLLHEDAARRIGVQSAALEAAPVATARGVDGGAIRLHGLRFGTMQVGEDRVVSPRLWVGGFRRGVTDVLLGADYLLARRAWIAYRASRMFVQAA